MSAATGIHTVPPPAQPSVSSVKGASGLGVSASSPFSERLVHTCNHGWSRADELTLLQAHLDAFIPLATALVLLVVRPPVLLVSK